MYIKDSIAKDIINLGIKKGDIVFIRGNLGKIGRFNDKSRMLLIDVLLDIIGEEGTLVTLGFSKSYPFYKVNKDFVFDKSSPTTTGALAKSFLTFPGIKRSQHPTNSFLAIGKKADYILDGHDENSLAYSPMQKIIELNAKMILFGVIKDSPGFTTVHYAQEVLELTKRSIFKNLFRVYYKRDREVKLYIKKDIGGCSKGFDKFYKHYLDHNIMTIGRIGKSTAICVPSKEAYNIEFNLLNKNNSYHFCDDPLCISCRVSWKYDLKYLPNYIILKIVSFIFKEKK